MTDLTHLTLVEAADSIATSAFTARELTQACLKRAEAWQPVLNCFIELDAEAALLEAEAADRMQAKGNELGPLHGIPFALKDIYNTKGTVDDRRLEGRDREHPAGRHARRRTG